MEPTENDPITRRLRSLGDQPVDPEIASRHRSLIAGVPVASSRSRFRPLIVGSLLAGTFFGGMGLAAAAPGVPDSASRAAQSVLATVTLGVVDHPDAADHDAAEAADHDAEKADQAKDAADEANDGPKAAKTESDDDHGAVRSYANCPVDGDKTGTHGQYVSSVNDDPATHDVNEHALAAKSDCGKPVHPEHSANEDNANKPDDPKHAADDHRQNGTHPADAVDSEHGQSNVDHPAETPDTPETPEAPGDHATSGRSGHGHGGGTD